MGAVFVVYVMMEMHSNGTNTRVEKVSDTLFKNAKITNNNKAHSARALNKN